MPIIKKPNKDRDFASKRDRAGGLSAQDIRFDLKIIKKIRESKIFGNKGRLTTAALHRSTNASNNNRKSSINFGSKIRKNSEEYSGNPEKY